MKRNNEFIVLIIIGFIATLFDFILLSDKEELGALLYTFIIPMVFMLYTSTFFVIYKVLKFIHGKL